MKVPGFSFLPVCAVLLHPKIARPQPSVFRSALMAAPEPGSCCRMGWGLLAAPSPWCAPAGCTHKLCRKCLSNMGCLWMAKLCHGLVRECFRVYLQLVCFAAAPKNLLGPHPSVLVCACGCTL